MNMFGSSSSSSQSDSQIDTSAFVKKKTYLKTNYIEANIRGRYRYEKSILY